MGKTPDPRDLELLGLQPGAGMGELRRAYHRALATWDEGALATYGLVEGPERDAILARMTAAYERLARCLDAEPRPAPAASTGTSPDDGPVPDDTFDEVAPGESGVDPPAELDPGAFLRSRRVGAGIGLDTVARETRIRRTILEALEEGRTNGLPASVYVRGFVIAYAELVGIEDPQGLARRYIEWLDGRRG